METLKKSVYEVMDRRPVPKLKDTDNSEHQKMHTCMDEKHTLRFSSLILPAATADSIQRFSAS